MTHDDNGSGRRPFERAGDDLAAGGAWPRGDRATGEPSGRGDRAAGGAWPRDERDTGAASGRDAGEPSRDGDRAAGDAPGVGDRPLRGLPRAGADDELAPVIPLFGARSRSAAAHPASGGDHGAARKTGAIDTADGLSAIRPRLRPLRPVGMTAHEVDGPAGFDDDEAPGGGGHDDDGASAEARERAEALLLRKLRSRSLSLSEARGVVRAADGVDDTVADEILDHFVDLGYLDDTVFAEQLAMTAVEKKGEGRRAVAETLRKRGIPRDIAEAALATLPDDDAERALEFARSKVRGVDGAEFDTALRRLAGQLGRRGYPSSVALSAARTALQEAGIGRSRSFARPASGVRFTPDE